MHNVIDSHLGSLPILSWEDNDLTQLKPSFYSIIIQFAFLIVSLTHLLEKVQKHLTL